MCHARSHAYTCRDQRATTTQSFLTEMPARTTHHQPAGARSLVLQTHRAVRPSKNRHLRRIWGGVARVECDIRHTGRRSDTVRSEQRDIVVGVRSQPRDEFTGCIIVSRTSSCHGFWRHSSIGAGPSCVQTRKHPAMACLPTPHHVLLTHPAPLNAENAPERSNTCSAL